MDCPFFSPTETDECIVCQCKVHLKELCHIEIHTAASRKLCTGCRDKAHISKDSVAPCVCCRRRKGRGGKVKFGTYNKAMCVQCLLNFKLHNVIYHWPEHNQSPPASGYNSPQIDALKQVLLPISHRIYAPSPNHFIE